jgi:hypothetical protein
MLGLCHYPVANLRSQLPISLAEISYASVRFLTLITSFIFRYIWERPQERGAAAGAARAFNRVRMR